MKYLTALFIPLMLTACSTYQYSKASRGISSEKNAGECFKDMCVGDTVFHLFGKTKATAMKKIETLTLEDYEGRVIIPKANLKKNEFGGMVYDDLRSFVKWEENQQICSKQDEIEFCNGQTVGVIPDSVYEMEKMKIFRIYPYNDGITDKVSEKFFLESSKNSSELESTFSVALIDEGQSFGPEKQLRVGESYSNGVGSEDKILGYFPYKHEVFIAAGDRSGKHYKISVNSMLDRIKGNYQLQFKAPTKFTDSARAVSGKLKLYAEERVLAEAERNCGFQFLGNGTLDKVKSAKPEITNCEQYIDKGGFSHGLYGPSRNVRCAVNFTYTCTHKNLVK